MWLLLLIDMAFLVIVIIVMLIEVCSKSIKLLCDASQRKIEAWELVSTNILLKYSGPIDIWLSILYSMSFSDGLHCLLNEQPSKSYFAMAQHMSQWVWFRKLFVSFSGYTSVNTLKEINKLDM